MKKKIKQIGFIAIAAIIGLCIAACQEESGNTIDIEDEEENYGEWTPPSSNVINLTEGIWTDSNITYGGEQWFRFTSTAALHFINISFGTLNVNVQLYDSNGNKFGSVIEMSYKEQSNEGVVKEITVTVGQVYYIKVWSSSDTGFLGIVQYTLFTPSKPTIPIPSNVISLTEGIWADSNISHGGEQWFKLPLTTISTNYLHFNGITLNNIDIQLYILNNFGKLDQIGSETNMTDLENVRLILISDNVYYIKVWSHYPEDYGTFRIAFNDSLARPLASFPTNVTELTDGIWIDGNITTAGNEQWFRFTKIPTENDGHYIHFNQGTLDSVNVQFYDVDGYVNGLKLLLNNTETYIYLPKIPSGETYYISVSSHDRFHDTGTFQLMYNTFTAPAPVTLPPDSDINELTESYLRPGNIATAGGEQWFRFTATANVHYIHFYPNTLKGINVYFYDSNGYLFGSTDLNSYKLYQILNTKKNAAYYIKVLVSDSEETGTFYLGFNTGTARPTQIKP